MKIKKLVTAIAIVIVGLTGCYHDKEELLYPSDTTRDCSNPTSTKGPLFTQVESICQANCISCHSTSGGQTPDLTTACSIVDKWDRIKVRCVDLKTMPQGNPLSTQDQQKITAWVNAGHKFTD